MSNEREHEVRAEIEQCILLDANRMNLCRRVYGLIRTEWVGKPYWPAGASFSSVDGPVGAELRVDIEFDAFHKDGGEDAEGGTLMRSLHVSWNAVRGDYAESSEALGEIWSEFLRANTNAIRKHFARAIGMRIVLDEHVAEIEARNEARAQESA